MQVDIFTICDAATFSEGKLNILGTFDTIWTDSFPCTYGSFSVATRIRFSIGEQGAHTLCIHSIDPDGKPVESSEFKEFEIEFNDNPTEIYSMLWHLRSKKFTAETEYHFELRVDGISVGTVPFFVKQKKPRPQPSED